MNCEDARLALHDIGFALTPIMEVTGDTDTERTASLRAIIDAHADAPLGVARGIKSLLDQLRISHAPGVDDPVISMWGRRIVEDMDSIVWLVQQELYEAAWFRANSGVDTFSSYLDALKLFALAA